MSAVEWALALVALGFLGGAMFTLIRIEDKLNGVLEELRFLNQDRRSAEFDRAVDAERERLEAPSP